MAWCWSDQEDALSSTGSMGHPKCLALWPPGLHPMHSYAAGCELQILLLHLFAHEKQTP